METAAVTIIVASLTLAAVLVALIAFAARLPADWVERDSHSH